MQHCTDGGTRFIIQHKCNRWSQLMLRAWLARIHFMLIQVACSAMLGSNRSLTSLQSTARAILLESIQEMSVRQANTKAIPLALHGATQLLATSYPAAHPWRYFTRYHDPAPAARAHRPASQAAARPGSVSRPPPPSRGGYSGPWSFSVLVEYFVPACPSASLIYGR